MQIGIVSNTALCLPFLSMLCSQKQAFSFYYAYGGDVFDQHQVDSFCNQHQILITKESGPDTIYEWAASRPCDIVFISGYQRLLQVSRLGNASYGWFNIHFGNLPSYRGPSPVFWQLKNGENNPGLCIHRLAAKADSGAIIWQKQVRKQAHYNYTFLNQIFSQLQVEGVMLIIKQLTSGVALPEQEQSGVDAVYYNRPILEDVIVNWKTMPVSGIVNLCQACNAWNMGAVTQYNGVAVKLLDVTAAEQFAPAPPGTVLHNKNTLKVSSIGGVLDIHYLSLNGVLTPGRWASEFGIAEGQKFG